MRCSHKVTTVLKNEIKYRHDAGQRDIQIAAALNLSQATVSRHLKYLGRTVIRLYRQDRISSTEALCTRCKKLKLLTEFAQFSSICRKCVYLRKTMLETSSIERYLKRRLTKCKANCKYLGIEFGLSFDHIFSLFVESEGRCFYTDKYLTWAFNDGNSWDRLSFDRINPIRGYVDGNIVLCTRKANSVKSFLTFREIEKWLPDWYSRLLRKFPYIENEN